jgi:hypothetical protein
VTTKRDSDRKQREAKSAKRPKLKKEKLADLDARDESVRGGRCPRATAPSEADNCEPGTVHCGLRP